MRCSPFWPRLAGARDARQPGGIRPRGTPGPQGRHHAEQKTTIVHGVLAIVLTLVVLQLWLISATMNAYLGGDDAVIWPAAVASGVVLALNVGLLENIRRMERP